MTAKHLLCSLALIARFAGAAGAAPGSEPRDLVTVTFVDILPNRAAEGERLILAEAAAARADRGCAGMLVLQQQGLPNHFTVVATWRERRAFEDHEGSAHTLAFRTALQPLLGSPLDERLNEVAP